VHACRSDSIEKRPAGQAAQSNEVMMLSVVVDRMRKPFGQCRLHPLRSVVENLPPGQPRQELERTRGWNFPTGQSMQELCAS
jgi:hypothetical protein